MEGDKRKVRIQKVLFPVSLIAILTRSSFRRTKAGLYCVWPTRQKVTFCRLKVGAKHDAKLQNFLKTKYKNMKKIKSMHSRPRSAAKLNCRHSNHHQGQEYKQGNGDNSQNAA